MIECKILRCNHDPASACNECDLHADFVLENGALLYFMEEAPGAYESGSSTLDGKPTEPRVYVPVYHEDEMKPSAFTDVGPRKKFAAIVDFSIPFGLPGTIQRQEPGYVLDNGLVLMESERDEQGRYKAGAGMDGMYLQTGRRFIPIRYGGKEIIAFIEET